MEQSQRLKPDDFDCIFGIGLLLLEKKYPKTFYQYVGLSDSIRKADQGFDITTDFFTLCFSLVLEAIDEAEKENPVNGKVAALRQAINEWKICQTVQTFVNNRMYA